MLKNAVIASLCAIVLLLGTALVRVENERYALRVGMCQGKPIVGIDYECLRKVETRTGWWWHMYYALAG